MFLVKEIRFTNSLIESNKSKALDIFLQYKTPEKPKRINEIVILDIDEKSLKALGRWSSLPNLYFAKVVDFISEGGAMAIGFDIFFTETDSLPQLSVEEYTAKIKGEFPDLEESEIQNILSAVTSDEIFAQSIENSGVVFLSMFDNAYEKDTSKVILPENLISYKIQNLENPNFTKLHSPKKVIDLLSEKAFAVGFAHVNPDQDGVTRHFPLFFDYKNEFYVNFSFQILLDLLGATKVSFDENESSFVLESDSETLLKIPVNENLDYLLNFYGEGKTFRYVSFSDVLTERISKKFFKDKIVLVGSSAFGLQDLKTIPVSDELFPGVELHATFLFNALNEDFILTNSYSQKIILLILIGLLSGLIFNFLPSIKWTFFALCLVGVSFFVALEVFLQTNFLFEFVEPIILVALNFVLVMIYKLRIEKRERQQAVKAFAQYIPKKVVNELLAKPDQLKLGGEERFMSVMFLDVAGFTTISEKLSPTELTGLLNEFLTAMTEVIFSFDGIIDKYEGDAIMAEFGAPLKDEKHAEKSCFAALKMQKRLEKLRLKWKAENKPELNARIGINSGKMVLGNMGSEIIFDYTVMGDSVNLSSRLEGTNKVYGTKIMLGEATNEIVKDKFFTRKLDRVRVKGKNKPVEIFELVSSKEESLSQETKAFVENYENALKFYFGQKFDEAILGFTKCLKFREDLASELMILTCKELQKKPPPKDWDGSRELISK